MIRRLTPLHLLIAAMLVFDAAAVGAHEVAVRSAPCYWAVWRVPQCRVMP